jgi:predicted phage tail protein
MLNFTLNQSSQNAEQHTYSTYFGNSLLNTVVKGNNISTIFGMLYKKYNKN